MSDELLDGHNYRVQSDCAVIFDAQALLLNPATNKWRLTYDAYDVDENNRPYRWRESCGSVNIVAHINDEVQRIEDWGCLERAEMLLLSPGAAVMSFAQKLLTFNDFYAVDERTCYLDFPRITFGEHKFPVRIAQMPEKLLRIVDLHGYPVL